MICCQFVSNTFSQKLGYTISGNIKNLPDGIPFYLVLNKDDGYTDTVARVRSKNQKFTFIGVLKDEAQFAFVKLDTSVFKLWKQKDAQGKNLQSSVRLLLNNSESIIKLIGNVNDWPQVAIEGSKSTNEYDKFLDRIKIDRENSNKKIEENRNDSAKVAEALMEYNEAFLKNLDLIYDSFAVPFLVLKNSKFGLETLQRRYDALSDKLKYSYYGKKLYNRILSIKQSKEIGLGKIIPDFQVKSSDGKLESVRDLAKKYNYTLVDFWASWCVPCRQDIPNMKKVYEVFHEKGFNIISISTDSSLPSWQKALKEENTSWKNSIQMNKESDNIFGLISIPGYILLNNKAEIVQMDLNSKFFSEESIGKLNGSPVFIKDSKKKGLRGDDLYEVIEGLLGKPEGK